VTRHSPNPKFAGAALAPTVAVAALLLCGLLLTACAAPVAQAPTPVPPTAAPQSRPVVPTPTDLPLPTAAPTTAPAVANNPELAGLKTPGVLRVATSLDNPPFSTVNAQHQPDGLDVALITELAKRLGLRADIGDFAFDHLGPSLVDNEADVAIAALSITPERSSQMDFTNVYYVGQDAVLAPKGSTLGKIATLDDLAKLKVGVQKGSVYEAWVQENAVQPGKMPPANLVAFRTPDDALEALGHQIDVFLLDLMPARAFEQQDKAVMVGEGLYPQVYGIAVRKGSGLVAPLNRVLAEAQADGTLKSLVEQYVNAVPADVLPATSGPLASPTP
jgi:ABC-type amino acid transport substrate-binding protein